MKKRFAKNKTLKKGEYYRKTGTYQYKWTDSYGKRHSISAKTLDRLRELENDIHQDSLEGLTSSPTTTVNDYFELWLKIKSGIRDSTRKTYIRNYRRYIEPAFGCTPLKDVSYSRLLLFYKKLASDKKLGYSIIRTLNTILGMVLDVAMRDNLIRGNPCRGALNELQRELPRPNPVRALTEEEQNIFETFLYTSKQYNRYMPIFITALYTGCRCGELLSLQWGTDIDFENNYIFVRHTIAYYDLGKGKGSVLHMHPPKTPSSIRTIPLLPQVKQALIIEKNYQLEHNIVCQDNIDGFSDFVFINSKGHLYTYKKLNNLLYKISDAINEAIQNGDINTELAYFPKLHTHIFRHCMASMLNAAHCNLKATSTILGHKNSTTNITLDVYTDVSDDFLTQEMSILVKNK